MWQVWWRFRHAEVYNFLYAHPLSNVYLLINRTLCSEHHYQSLIGSHYADTTLGYKTDELLRSSRSAVEASLSSHCLYISHPIFTGRRTLPFWRPNFKHPSDFNRNVSLFLHRDMSGKVIVVFALLVALLVSEASAAGETKGTNVLQQLLTKHETVKDSDGKQRQAPRTDSARVERRTHLSEDEREMMTKQIMQAISGMPLAWVWKFCDCFVVLPSVREMCEWAEIQGKCSDLCTERLCVCGSCRNGLFTELMNSECMTDRDYRGWVDFGRRDAEWGASREKSRTAFFYFFCSDFILKRRMSCSFINKLFCRFIKLVLIPFLWWWTGRVKSVLDGHEKFYSQVVMSLYTNMYS